MCVCSIHVASVVQLTHMLMTHGGMMKATVVDELTLLASLMAATVHDLGHGGVNNDFLNRYHPLCTVPHSARHSARLCCAPLCIQCSSLSQSTLHAVVVTLYVNLRTAYTQSSLVSLLLPAVIGEICRGLVASA